MPHRNGLAQTQSQTTVNVDVLRERVFTLERGQDNIRSELHEFRNTVSQGFQAIRDDINKSTESRRLPLTTIIVTAGFFLSVLTLMGGLAYSPIKTTTDKLEQEVAIVRSQLVPRVEHNDTYGKIFAAIEKLERRSEENNKTKADKEVFSKTTEDIQRQINEQRQVFGSAYSLKDALQDLRKDVDTLRTRIVTKDSQ